MKTRECNEMSNQDQLDDEYDEYAIAAWKHADKLAMKITKFEYSTCINDRDLDDFRNVRLEIFKNLLNGDYNS